MTDDNLEQLFAMARETGKAPREADAQIERERTEFKMWLAIRTDLRLSRGKAYTHAGHCYGRLYLNAAESAPEALAAYLADNEPKISVRVKDESALRRVAEECKAAGIPHEIVQDAGRSEIPPGTYTFCAFGPAKREDLPKYLQRLQVLQDKDLPDAPTIGDAERPE